MGSGKQPGPTRQSSPRSHEGKGRLDLTLISSSVGERSSVAGARGKAAARAASVAAGEDEEVGAAEEEEEVAEVEVEEFDEADAIRLGEEVGAPLRKAPLRPIREQIGIVESRS